MNLRAATADDAERIVLFWHDSGASIGPLDSVAQVRGAITHPAAHLLLAESGEALVGTLLGTFDGWRGNMYRLVVHPDWRRRGIARRITVLIEVDRPWAVAFWTAVGYPRDHHIVRHLGTM